MTQPGRLDPGPEARPQTEQEREQGEERVNLLSADHGHDDDSKDNDDDDGQKIGEAEKEQTKEGETGGGDTEDGETEDGQTEYGEAEEGETDYGEAGDPQKSGIPIDGGWGWVVVAATFGMHVLVVGGVKSFGVLFLEFQDKYHVTARELGIVQGLATTSMMSLGLVANLLAVKLTCRKVVFVGGLLTSLGFLTSAYISSFSLLYLTYGIITGLGFALSYSPCVVMVGCHFKERRSLANGISVSGSGVGSFLLPNLMRWMLNQLNLEGCLLLISAIMLNICVFAMLIRPLSSYTRRQTRIPFRKSSQAKETSGQELKQLMVKGSNKPVVISVSDFSSCPEMNSKNVPEVSTMDDVSKRYTDSLSVLDKEPLAAANGKSKLSLSVLDKDSSYRHSTGDLGLVTGSLQTISQPQMEQEVSKLGQRLCGRCCHRQAHSPRPKTDQRLFEWSLLSNPVFMVYALSCCFANFAYPNIFFMLPAFAESNGQSRDNSALLVSIIGITDLIGRLFFGWFSDLKLFPRRYGFIGCIALSGVLNLLAPALTSFVAMAIYASLYGFFAGSYVALVAVMLADALGVDKLSSSYGLTTLAMAVGLLPGAMICGGIRDATEKWDFAFIFCGIMALVGSAFPVFEPCAQRMLASRSHRKS